MEYWINKQIRDRQALRRSFQTLTQNVYGFTFEEWHRQGYWGSRYLPYCLCRGEQVIANISVNRMETVWDGEKKQNIQLGTVMTEPSFRNQGHIRRLMEEVLEDWAGRCDMMYLFANATVLDFYPKFGFERVTEYRCTLPVSPLPAKVRKLDIGRAEDLALLRAAYQKSNPFSLLPSLHNFGLLMFYAIQFLREHLYYIEDLEAVVVAEREEGTLFVSEIYCSAQTSMPDVLSAIAGEGDCLVELGFMPNREFRGARISPIMDEDDALFLLSGKENPFLGRLLRFPVLSHT